jgi:predicted alpha/beta superfamily hydrolase
MPDSSISLFRRAPRVRLMCGGLAALLALAGAAVALASDTTPPAGAKPAAAKPAEVAVATKLGHPAEVTVPDTRRINFISKVNGHGYSIDVALPQVPPPAKGYPVIYVFDGGAYFASFTEAVRTNANAPQAIVVAIGYPHDDAWAGKVLSRFKDLPSWLGNLEQKNGMAQGLERIYDLTFTPCAASEIQSMGAVGLKLATTDCGGADDFLKTIETEIKPRVYALAPVDRTNQALFGHSLGGLAVLHALLTEPNAFRTFIAASPSIWWNDKAVLAKEAEFAETVKRGEAKPRILVTVGAEEETMPRSLPKDMQARKAEIQEQVRKVRMVGNARDLVARLKALQGAKGYEVADCAVFSRQAHGISVWPAIGRAVSFAFP